MKSPLFSFMENLSLSIKIVPTFEQAPNTNKAFKNIIDLQKYLNIIAMNQA
jgi:hypothetical protein